ncbi:hypothetical protein OG453_28680 [Streptomyces sp. NBC_01381]|uniref:hypothetical protein n=1 Tax=Streptomyces sp. NBC_01381 TaxID=2903845 RepID=UPI002252D9F9|nr:hypothetical protein [Streptomyces sp. NBC_01381]MCX4670621.1 hypothetical protein [Streptomyces sp. NBC_01381]
MARARDRPVEVAYRRLPSGLTGFCAQLAHRDVIVIGDSASPLNRILTGCHELVHLWRGHTPTPGALFDSATARTLLPGIRPDVVRGVLMGRSHYGAPLEREAEVVATQLVTMLDLRADQIGNAQLAASLAHRRTGV